MCWQWLYLECGGRHLSGAGMASKRGSERALWFNVTSAAESQPKELFLGAGLEVKGWNQEMVAIIAVKGGKEMDSSGSKIGLFDWKRLLRTIEEH